MKIDGKKLGALVKSHGLTNTRLAAEAGITRQALQTLLRGNQLVEVREKTAKGLARALRLPNESLLAPDPLVGYKEAVAEDNADLTFRGLGLPTTEPRSMDDLFVPVRLQMERKPVKGPTCRPSAGDKDELLVDQPAGLTVAASLMEYRRLLIAGEPGSGKTTALRHEARAAAKGQGGIRRSQRPVPTPLFVRLAEFSKARERESEMTLTRFVVTRALPKASPEYWSQVERNLDSELAKGACLVMLDGLDEVGNDRELVTVLSTFVSSFGQNQFVLTSRIVGLDAKPWQKLNFVSFQVARWREEDIREFVRRWYAVPASRRKESRKLLDRKADEFTTTILSHPSLSEIAANPLMLTMLAALHHADAHLPRRRVDLYAKIVEVMLELWEKSKREARPGEPLHGIVLDGRDFCWLLGRLALDMQREGQVLRPRWSVNDIVQQFLHEQLALEGSVAKDQSERVIRYLCERAGLLVERGDGIFGFHHRTFQEYFAARGLLLEAEGGRDVVSLLRPYLYHPQWEEVVVHVAALLAPPRATSLIRVILDDADPAGRFLRRGQRVALRCLVDGAAIADRAVLDQVFSDGEEIGKSRWLGIAISIKSDLAQLKATRHQAEAEHMLQAIDQAAKNDLSASDYLAVLLAEGGELPDPPDIAPGTIYEARIGGRPVELMSTGWKKRLADSDAWFSEVLRLVRSKKADFEQRIRLIELLRTDTEENEKVRRTLKELLVHDQHEAIRAACVEALEDAVTTDPSIAKLLVDRLDEDSSDIVRARCVEALRSIAASRADVRARLEEHFESGAELVRAGAARGLSRLGFRAEDQQELLGRFLATLSSPAEPACVRQACIWAVAALLGRDDLPAVSRAVESILEDHEPMVRYAALHSLADAIAAGRLKWSEPLVERIETMLMEVANPCPHLYGDLERIVALKEIQGGRRMKRLLDDCLAAFGDQISIAFVFGSVARHEQVPESDLDLMIIGDVRLKELAAALHEPEKTLGRTVNPVLFSREKFREQYREGNPFLLDVVRKEKTFLKGTRDELTELVADGSPD